LWAGVVVCRAAAVTRRSVPYHQSLLLDVQLGASTTALYKLRNGQNIFSLVFNSTAVFRGGAKYVTFKAVGTLPSGSYVDARVGQIVNFASGAVQFNFVVSNSGTGNSPVTIPGRVLQTTAVAPDGTYGFMCVAWCMWHEGLAHGSEASHRGR